MTLRIVGVLLLVAGTALAGFGVYSVLHGPASAAIAEALIQSFVNPEFIYSTFVARWRLWSVGIAAIGGAIAIGGAAVLLGRSWGFLVAASALLGAALVPWVVQTLKLTRYAFEQPDTLETIVYLALSGIAAICYHRVRSAN
jgi:hypothetical protein